MNLIDTADSYGPEVSENLIAEALHPYPEDLVIATKGGLTRPGPGSWEPDGRPEHLQAVLRGQPARGCELDADRPLPAAHGRPEGALRGVGRRAGGAAATRARSATSGSRTSASSSSREAREIVPVVSVQNRYSIAGRATPRTCSRPASATASASSPGSRSTPARSAERAALEEIARAHDATPVQVALAWLLAHSPVMLPIPGTSSLAHLEENVAAAALAAERRKSSSGSRLRHVQPVDTPGRP